MHRVFAAPLFAVFALAACSQPTQQEPPAEPEKPAMQLDALNSVQLAEIVRTFGPPGIKCQNAWRIENMGVVPENAPSLHGQHVGARAYSIFCNHPEMEQNAEDPDQQWVIWVKSVDPLDAAVARCFEPGQSHQGDNICWDALYYAEAIR